jgi:type I restriction enzyme, S subunit
MATENQKWLGDIVRFGNGKAIKPGGTGVYPVYGSNGIIGGSDDYCHENGVVIGRVGAYCGAVLYCPSKFWASDNTLVAYPSSDQIDIKFLYYLLADAKLSRYAGGAAQPLVTQTVLRQVEVCVPPIPTQRRIASILSAYDELIENSQRRIKILEAMARALYREWFVHFRFPGHESVPRVPSLLGEIPHGWEVKKLGDILELKYGKALKKEDRQPGDYPVFGSSGIVGTHKIPLAEGPGIIVGRKGNVGSIFWSDDDYFVIDTAYFVTSSLPLRYLLYVLPTLNFINSDAAVPGLSRSQAYSLDVIVPPIPVLSHFCQSANHLGSQVKLLKHEVQILRSTRDLLLPNLIADRIDL